MGLSRRLFTKEFKLAAVRRLEEGVPIGEVARGLEVNPNVLHRWRREFRQGPGNVFPGKGKQRWSEGKIAAACESFMKTLKYEEVHRNEYRDLAEARASIAEFLDKIYNQKRLHSALGYLPPAEFEANQATIAKKDAVARPFSL